MSERWEYGDRLQTMVDKFNANSQELENLSNSLEKANKRLDFANFKNKAFVDAMGLDITELYVENLDNADFIDKGKADGRLVATGLYDKTLNLDGNFTFYTLPTVLSFSSELFWIILNYEDQKEDNSSTISIEVSLNNGVTYQAVTLGTLNKLTAGKIAIIKFTVSGKLSLYNFAYGLK